MLFHTALVNEDVEPPGKLELVSSDLLPEEEELKKHYYDKKSLALKNGAVPLGNIVFRISNNGEKAEYRLFYPKGDYRLRDLGKHIELRVLDYLKTKGVKTIKSSKGSLKKRKEQLERAGLYRKEKNIEEWIQGIRGLLTKTKGITE